MESKTAKVKYCWFNPAEGKFSNSWPEEMHYLLSDSDINEPIQKGWRLLKFECLNDANFEFSKLMKLR